MAIQNKIYYAKHMMWKYFSLELTHLHGSFFLKEKIVLTVSYLKKLIKKFLHALKLFGFFQIKLKLIINAYTWIIIIKLHVLK